MKRENRTALLKEILSERVMILDGAMGTMIQKYNLTEEDYRGEKFKGSLCDLKGNNDLLSITRPDVIKEIHEKYLVAGADILETNTFNANSVSQSDYDLTNIVYELNVKGAQNAKEVALKFEQNNPDRKIFIAGILGPTNRTASLSPDVEDPAKRNITFDELVETYYEAAEGLFEGGVDIFLIETIFDTLNAKAAIYACKKFNERSEIQIPIMISATITDASGRSLTGQSVKAMYYSIQHSEAISVGLNCSLGAKEILPYVKELSEIAECGVNVHPNAGFPDELGNYNDSPEHMAGLIKGLEGMINIVGGCCGTTPEHIKAIAETVKTFPPRKPVNRTGVTTLSGLDPLEITKDSLFVNVGERTNVAGSRKFARLIREKKYEEALDIAKKQVENGAQIIDVNLDDAMLDSQKEMKILMNYIASEPDICKVPIMIDSSKWDVISEGLKTIQGKGIVNSLSLKEGEEELIKKASEIKKFGAAIVFMAFDEDGQADTKERKVEICRRGYKVLTETVGIPATDIIFDPNIFAIGTGIKEHNRYALDFIEATDIIKKEMPEALISGGVSNVSFSFRGNNPLREAIHSVFLYHAVKAGMDMGIVNAGQLTVYEDIDDDLRERIEDLVLNRRDDATERLLDIASDVKDSQKGEQVAAWRELPVEERISHALVKGITEFIEADLFEIKGKFENSVDIIEGPLMNGMNRVGELFGSGQMFLPQVVKSARVMKNAVAIIMPWIESEKIGDEKYTKGKILMATVKGDVHDIGKNIVGIVLKCNGYEVVDLGVMVPSATILAEAKKENVDAVGLSGLITPSLDEMVNIAELMEKDGFSIPLVVGGATTSQIHTAVKIAPNYSGCVAQVKDASMAPGVFTSLLTDPDYKKILDENYSKLKENKKRSNSDLLSFTEASENKFNFDWSGYTPPEPSFTGNKVISKIKASDLLDFIDWKYFLRAWNFKGSMEEIMSGEESGKEASNLISDAQEMLNLIDAKFDSAAKAVIGFYWAESFNNDISLFDDSRNKIGEIHTLRQQFRKSGTSANFALSDFIAPKDSGKNDYIGLFAVTAGHWLDSMLKFVGGDEYKELMFKILADRLAEAAAEKIHLDTRKKYWGYSPDESLSREEILVAKYRGIRPAPGYPACPDHTEKEFLLNKVLSTKETIGVNVSESYMMIPAASVSGYYFSHPDSFYYALGKIGMDQVEDYAKRKDMPLDTVIKWLSQNIAGK